MLNLLHTYILPGAETKYGIIIEIFYFVLFFVFVWGFLSDLSSF